MCAYPDLLMYVWYNFIIDIDIENEEFEWVKYSKENKLNERRNLAKLFLNLGYFTPKGRKQHVATLQDIKKGTIKCNDPDQGYQLANQDYSDALQVVENP